MNSLYILVGYLCRDIKFVSQGWGSTVVGGIPSTWPGVSLLCRTTHVAMILNGGMIRGAFKSHQAPRAKTIHFALQSRDSTCCQVGPNLPRLTVYIFVCVFVLSCVLTTLE